MGRSVEQSVLADLTVSAPGRVMDVETSAPDAAAALDAAQKNGARYVVFGSYATIGNDVRVTGQILDVTSGKSVSAIKATGPSNQLFPLEDELAAQIRNRLALNPTPGPGDQNPAEVQAQMAPLTVQPEPANPYLQAYGNVAAPAGEPQTDYNYYYGQPYNFPYFYGGWGWGWGVWGVSSVNSFSFDDHHRYHHNWSIDKDLPSNEQWNGSYAAGLANSSSGVPLGPVNTGSISSPRFFGPGVRGSVTFHSGTTTIHASTAGISRAPRASFAPAPRSTMTNQAPAAAHR